MDYRMNGRPDQSGRGLPKSKALLRFCLALAVIFSVLSSRAALAPGAPPFPTVSRTNTILRPRWSAGSNLPPGLARSSLRNTNASPMARAAGKTNAAAAQVAKGAKATAPVQSQSGGERSGNVLVEKFQQFRGSRAFYPAIVAIFACLGAIVLFWSLRRKPAPAVVAPPVAATFKPISMPLKKGTGSAPVNSCNVLRVGADQRQLWQFDARGGKFVLSREQTSFAGEPLPAGLVAKDWRSLFQRKLNLAWLPPEHVFVRVAQFPGSDFKETVAMVELKLETLSPMPVTQIVWSIHRLPHADGKMQTVIVLIAARNAVEEFLGQLEGQGYLADALELPLLDQLQATAITEDGAWIYPEVAGGKNTALVAWWYGGVLRNLDLITLPPASQPAILKEQFMQMAWAGELEGWLTSPPGWHLVAEGEIARQWEESLRAALEQPIDVLAPLSAGEMAALTARRAASAEPGVNLLPAEFSTRYRQQFVDRLWMRGLLAVGAVYVLGVLIYGVALGFLSYRTGSVENQVADLGLSYTNAVQLKQRYGVLKDREELKFAALDCWNYVAKLMPEGLTLDSLNFSEGKRLSLKGTAPADQVSEINNFEDAMRKQDKDGQKFFDPNGGEHFITHSMPGGGMSWSFVLELKRSEVLQ